MRYFVCVFLGIGLFAMAGWNLHLYIADKRVQCLPGAFAAVASGLSAILVGVMP